jgi:hypothetical protein
MNHLQCEICGKEDALTFHCNYCGGYFCAEHHLPETHNCSRKPRTTPWFVQPSDKHQSPEISEEIAKIPNIKKIPYEYAYEAHFQINNAKPFEFRHHKRHRNRHHNTSILDKLERLPRPMFYLLICLFGVMVAAMFFLPDMLGQVYLKENDFFRFHLMNFCSTRNYIFGSGYIMIGIPLPIAPTLFTRTPLLALQFYGGFIIIAVASIWKGKKGFLIAILIVSLFSFLPAEATRLSTHDFSTRSELQNFLQNDNTNKIQYTSSFVCIDFTLTLINHAKAAGYRMYFASTDTHAFCEAYIISEGKWVYVEPQTDQISSEVFGNSVSINVR